MRFEVSFAKLAHKPKILLRRCYDNGFILHSFTLIELLVVVAIIAVIVLLVQAFTPEAQVYTAMVEATTIDVSSKIPGRLDSVYVREGDTVQKGQILGRLQSKEINAKVEQARGALQATKAKLSMALNGARPEERQAVKNLYLQAKHQYDLAEKTYRRVQSVYRDSVISEQERDQVEFKSQNQISFLQ